MWCHNALCGGVKALLLGSFGRAVLSNGADDAGLGNLDDHVGSNLHLNSCILHFADDAVDAACGDDLIAGFQGVLAVLHFLLLFALGADEQEVEDNADEEEGDEHVEPAGFLTLLCCLCDECGNHGISFAW